jgi:hypothetical protein
MRGAPAVETACHAACVPVRRIIEAAKSHERLTSKPVT